MKKTTTEIVELLTGAMNTGNQELINIYAYELTARLYVPGRGYSFDDILEGFGYKEIEDSKQITIDEYLEEIRKNERSRKRNQDN